MSKLITPCCALPDDAAALGHAYANAKPNHLATALYFSSLKVLGNDVCKTHLAPPPEHVASACMQVIQSFRQGRASELAA